MRLRTFLFENDDEIYLMNPATGSVGTKAEWLKEFNDYSDDEKEALWGGKKFEDADLVEISKEEYLKNK